MKATAQALLDRKKDFENMNEWMLSDAARNTSRTAHLSPALPASARWGEGSDKGRLGFSSWNGLPTRGYPALSMARCARREDLARKQQAPYPGPQPPLP